jgi:hypothetical protein
VTGHNVTQCRFSDNSSVFTAELEAIVLALDYYIASSNYDKFIIFSDSLSSLQAIHSCKLENPVVKTIIEKFHFLNISNNSIYFTGYQVMSGSRETKEPTLLPRHQNHPIRLQNSTL